MHRSALFVILFLGAIALGQEKPRRIGAIDFYGYGGLDVEKIRANLPVHEGENFPESTDARFAMIDKLNDAVKRETGKLPTDVDQVCCDANGQ